MKTIEEMYKEVSLFLQQNLKPELTYHNVKHTQYVFKKCKHIALKENVSKRDIFLLQIAALFHDMGYIKTRIEHEKVSCEMAAEWLKKYDLSKKDKDKIYGMIMATRIPQSPSNLLECIIADADLLYLGTTKFEMISNNLYKEILSYNPKLSLNKWNAIQVSFISNHQYHTDFCKRYYEFRKQNNLRSIGILIAK